MRTLLIIVAAFVIGISLANVWGFITSGGLAIGSAAILNGIGLAGVGFVIVRFVTGFKVYLQKGGNDEST